MERRDNKMNSMKELYVVLGEKLEMYKHNKVVLEDVKLLMQEYGIFRGETQKIFTNKVTLDSLDRRVLILLVDSLHRFTSEHGLNPYGYFTEKEIKDAKNQEIIINNEASHFPVKIHNVIKKEENKFVAFINAKELVRLYNLNLLGYNYNITKQYKMVLKNGTFVKTVDINSKDVKDIAQKILRNVYDMKPIVLNVVLGSGKGKELTFENNELKIHKSNIEIISGLHDVSALANILEEDSDLEIKVELEILHYNESDALNYYNKLSLKGGVN